MWGSGGVDPARAAAGVGQCAVFAGAVVADLVAADQLFTDRDLDVVTDDGNPAATASETIALRITKPTLSSRRVKPWAPLKKRSGRRGLMEGDTSTGITATDADG